MTSLPASESVVDIVNTSFAHLDSSALAALLKDLAKLGHIKRAVEIFDHLREMDSSKPMGALCDVYTYTTMYVHTRTERAPAFLRAGSVPWFAPATYCMA